MDLVTRAVWLMAGTVVGSPHGELRIASYYKLARCLIYYIRPQTEENWASRPLCHTQTSDRRVSSWVGDHQRIRAVVCFFLFLPFLGRLYIVVVLALLFFAVFPPPGRPGVIMRLHV